MSNDKLEHVRDAVRRHLGLQQRIAELTEENKLLTRQLNDMAKRELPDLFNEVQVDSVGLAPEGNQPGYDAKLSPYYHANIPADRAIEAFAWLDAEGHGDLIKNVITVELGRGDNETAKAVQYALDDLGIEYSTKLSVPWNTLTAFVREQVERYSRVPPLDILGAEIGQIVKLKERKP
jgi:hypothetical protein